MLIKVGKIPNVLAIPTLEKQLEEKLPAIRTLAAGESLSFQDKPSGLEIVITNPSAKHISEEVNTPPER